MLTVTQLNDGRLSIKSHYAYRHRIKAIPTASFDSDRKEWVIESFMLGSLEAAFPGELVYKTPRWVILHEPMPDMSQMYVIHDKTIQAPALKLKPYDYQDYGIRFMIDKIQKHGFVLNADDVGLGKTIQTIGVIKYFIERYGIRRVIVVCKKSIKKQWVDEFKKFTDLDQSMPIVYTGHTPAQRKKAYQKIAAAPTGILVTNYHTFLNDTKEINRLGFEFCVVDECHSVKARNGKLNNNISTVVRGKPTVFLTGTPIMSRPEDIFGIVQMVKPAYFGSWLEFKKRYLVTDMNGRFGEQVIGAKNLDELRHKVQDIVIRRTEFEVAVQLPQVILQTMDCDMDKTQEAILLAISEKEQSYTDFLEKLKQEEKGPNPDLMAINKKRQMVDSASKALIAAKQAASSDPRLFNLSNSSAMRTTYGAMVPKSYAMSSKTEAIIDRVEDIISNGDKVILFTKFRTCANLIAGDIQKALKTDVLLYTGGENENQRNQALDYFRNTATFNVLIGTEALAEGVNLQVAKFVINIDQPDTLAIKTQRIGRARRVGSKFGNVVVYDMITKSSDKANSKDEERLRNILNNQNLTDALVTLDDSQREALMAAMKAG